MDESGAAEELRLDHLRADLRSTVSLSAFSFDQIRQMCILSGCDYLPSITGIGIKRAWEYIRDYSDASQAIRAMRFQGTLAVPHGYEQGFVNAELTFKHQLVWDPATLSIKPITPYPPDLDPTTLQFAGPQMDATRSIGHVMGDLNPHTGEQFATDDLDEVSVSARKEHARLMKHGRISDKAEAMTAENQQNKMDRYVVKSVREEPTPKRSIDEMGHSSSAGNAAVERKAPLRSHGFRGLGRPRSSPDGERIKSKFFNPPGAAVPKAAPGVTAKVTSLPSDPRDRQSWALAQPFSTNGTSLRSQARGATRLGVGTAPLPTQPTRIPNLTGFSARTASQETGLKRPQPSEDPTAPRSRQPAVTLSSLALTFGKLPKAPRI